MSERQQQMIAAFIEYERRDPATLPSHNLVGVPVGTRLLRIYRRKGYWQLWLATRDYVFGTYMCLYDDGHIITITEYVDQGPDEINVRPTDEEIRNASQVRDT